MPKGSADCAGKDRKENNEQDPKQSIHDGLSSCGCKGISIQSSSDVKLFWAASRAA
jgi:hypothetical protein